MPFATCFTTCGLGVARWTAQSLSRGCFIHGLIAFKPRFFQELTPPSRFATFMTHESEPSGRFQRAGACAA